MVSMKTSVTSKKEERSPYPRDDDLFDQEKGGKMFSSTV